MVSPVPFQTLHEAERLAKRMLPRDVWLAVKAGNELQWTLTENVRAFTELAFSPTIFDRPTSIDTRTSVMGVDIDMPVIISPVGAQAIHPGGEIAAARAARQMGTAMGLSSWASNAVGDVVRANPDTFFQIYWVGRREQIRARVERAREAGVKGLIVTLDWSFTPRRDGGVPVAPPSDMRLATMARLAPGALSRPAWFARFVRRGRIPELRVPNLFAEDGSVPMFGTAWAEFEQTPVPTRDDIAWLRSIWDGPLMIKGITTIQDAKIAVDLGAEAISVSNHGGNNIDGTAAPIRYLPSIVDAVGDQIEVMVDGGVRRGSDVVKCIALGARAVFIGRAYLYGLAVSGQAGVHRVLDILKSGVRETMFGIGRSALSEIERGDLMVLNRDFFQTPTR